MERPAILIQPGFFTEILDTGKSPAHGGMAVWRYGGMAIHGDDGKQGA